MTNTLYVRPSSFEMGPSEEHHLGLDAVAVLGGATFTGTPSATLTDQATLTGYPAGVLGVPTISMGQILVCFIGNLQLGHNYLLSAVCEDTDGETWEIYLDLLCV